MKPTFSGLLIIAFVALAAFGTMAMGHGQAHDRIICIASAMQASGCPKEVVSAASFGFHLEAFNALFTAIFGNNLIGLISALAAFAVAMGLVLAFNPLTSFAAIIFEQNHRRLAESFVFPFNRPAISWLSLRERSPAKF